MLPRLHEDSEVHRFMNFSLVRPPFHRREIKPAFVCVSVSIHLTLSVLNTTSLHTTPVSINPFPYLPTPTFSTSTRSFFFCVCYFVSPLAFLSPHIFCRSLYHPFTVFTYTTLLSTRIPRIHKTQSEHTHAHTHKRPGDSSNATLAFPLVPLQHTLIHIYNNNKQTTTH